MFSSEGNKANYFPPEATWKQAEGASHVPWKGMLHL